MQPYIYINKYIYIYIYRERERERKRERERGREGKILYENEIVIPVWIKEEGRKNEGK